MRAPTFKEFVPFCPAQKDCPEKDCSVNRALCGVLFKKFIPGFLYQQMEKEVKNGNSKKAL